MSISQRIFQKAEKETEKGKSCGYCGKTGAHPPGRNCPAYGQQCLKCGKYNHYASCCRIGTVVIPGGMTSMLQPLDVSINKPFKDRMRAKWQDWMLAGHHSFTAGGCIRKVGLDEICRWITDAWDDIPLEMIAKSFRKCGITNALDGIEDKEIWEEESDSDPFEDLDEVDGDNQLYYADHFERQLAEIDPECFENISGESNGEDFYGF